MKVNLYFAWFLLYRSKHTNGKKELVLIGQSKTHCFMLCQYNIFFLLFCVFWSFFTMLAVNSVSFFFLLFFCCSGLWHEEDRFFYDVFHTPEGVVPIRLRSISGLVPLLACATIKLRKLSTIAMYFDTIFKEHPQHVSVMCHALAGVTADQCVFRYHGQNTYAAWIRDAFIGRHDRTDSCVFHHYVRSRSTACIGDVFLCRHDRRQRCVHFYVQNTSTACKV